MATIFDHDHHIYGRWLPKHRSLINHWVEKKLQTATQRVSRVYEHETVRELSDLIESNADIYMGFSLMFAAVPNGGPIGDYKQMLAALDIILGQAPQFTDSTLVALPITTILLDAMSTQAGFHVFSDPRVNAQFKKVLDTWHNFLASSASCSVLHTGPDGWFGPAASAAMPSFAETYVCDPDQAYWGFNSWDEFFIREFREGVRPVQAADDDSIITAACESTVFRTATDVSLQDEFWIKGHPYSLIHMLNGDPLASQFAGGTVFQGYLSALNYHRWRSPVNGRIVKTAVVPGTYYLQSIDAIDDTSARRSMGKPVPPMDLLDRSQDFITQVAARGLVFIETDNPEIGLMCFIAVGMGEVSTVDITVHAGDAVEKGDELGMFHFGGSTHCLLFRKEANVQFLSDYPAGTSVKVNAALAKIGALDATK